MTIEDFTPVLPTMEQCAAVVDGDGMPFDPFRSEQVAHSSPVELQPVSVNETKGRG